MSDPRSDQPADLLRRSLANIRAEQNRRVRPQIGLCARGSTYYRQAWNKAEINPDSIQTLDDLERLPLTPKTALMADPEAFRLHCPDLPLHERALWEVNYTTGSTGDPTPLYSTTHDYQAYLFQAARVAEISGINDRDIMANLFPLTPAGMGAFMRSAPNAYAAGAAVAGALTGARFGDYSFVQRSLDDAVAMAERHRATILWGVTSFVRRVIIRAGELGADFTHVRMCGVTGEASTPAMREDMRARLRAMGAKDPVILDRYGTTESGGLAQCHEDGPWHNPVPELLYHEVVDPETGRRLPDGERGALALTHLNRRGTALVRYLVGDIFSLEHDACPHCGRFGDRIIPPIMRTKDLMKVKGMLINPAVLFEAIRQVPEVDEFQFVLDRVDPNDPFSMDEMILRVATAATDRNTLTDRLVRAAQDAVRVRPRVVYEEDARAIYDHGAQVKAVRLVDRR
jgi:phenylacetate-CoA ligase